MNTVHRIPTFGFVWRVECVGPDGKVKWVEENHNLTTTVGLNDILDKYFAGAAYTAAWYLGLVDNAGFSAYAAGDTMASHAGWSESVVYSNATRPAVAFSAAAGGVKSTSAASSFTINSGGTVRGCFLVTDSTKGGASGILFSEVDFTSGSRAVLSGDTLNVTGAITGT